MACEDPIWLWSPNIIPYNHIYVILGSYTYIDRLVGFVIYFWPAVQDNKMGKEVTI